MREITDGEFESVTASGKVLVDFYATWCPPCKVLAPILESLDEEVGSITFVKINVDEHMTHASRSGITNLPTLVLYEDGIEVKRHVGAMARPALKAWLGV